MQDLSHDNPAFESREMERSSQAIESLMEDIVSSPELKEVLESTSEKLRPQTIGLAIEATIVFRDKDQIKAYLYAIKPELTLLEDYTGASSPFEKKKISIMIQQVIDQLGIQDIPENEKNDAVFNFIRKNFIEDGYYFHGFNGAFETSIKEHGLNPSERFWDAEELAEMDELGKRVGATGLLGWGTINSENKTSIANNPAVIYRYANSSPEWFAQFVAEGWHIRGADLGYDSDAYNRRDYTAARQNIELLCDELSSRDEAAIAQQLAYPNLTSHERDSIIQFFEKYWYICTGPNSHPSLALIDKKALGHDSDAFESFDESRAILEEIEGDTSLEASVSFLLDAQHIDKQITTTVPPENLHILTLPDYETIYPHANTRHALANTALQVSTSPKNTSY